MWLFEQLNIINELVNAGLIISFAYISYATPLFIIFVSCVKIDSMNVIFNFNAKKVYFLNFLPEKFSGFRKKNQVKMENIQLFAVYIMFNNENPLYHNNELYNH